jgi:Acyl-CoA carboxylase epsilon subunit
MAPRILLSVVRGEPSAEELAAITAVLTATTVARRRRPAAVQAPRSQWSARGRLMRPELRPGPGAWRASGLP